MPADGRDPHRRIPQVLRCEFERTLKGEYCAENGDFGLDGLRLCERHAYQLRLEERAAYWRAMLAHAELWSGEASSRGRDDVVGLLEIERARSAAALGRVLEDLEESRDWDGGDSSGDGRVSSLWQPFFVNILPSITVSG
jgi:hypothetical protein